MNFYFISKYIWKSEEKGDKGREGGEGRGKRAVGGRKYKRYKPVVVEGVGSSKEPSLNDT